MAPRSRIRRERAFVFDLDRLAVGHRQGKARALQQARGVAQIGERRDARAEAALDLAFRRGQRLAQLPQGGAAQHGAQQQPVGLQDAADLDQGAGQVVDPMQVHRAQHQVEALLPRTAGTPRRPPPPGRARGGQSPRRGRRAPGGPTVLRSPSADGDFVAMRAEVEGQGKLRRTSSRRSTRRSAISRLRKAWRSQSRAARSRRRRSMARSKTSRGSGAVTARM